MNIAGPKFGQSAKDLGRKRENRHPLFPLLMLAQPTLLEFSRNNIGGCPP